MTLIDTHCHLYLKEFDADRLQMMERARQVGVRKFCLPSIDSSEVSNVLKMEEDHPGECFAMIGLHPCSVGQNFEEELAIVKEWLEKKKFIAVGEIGLDYHWETTFVEQQRQAFTRQMDWALAYQLPIVIHSRSAITDTIAAVKPYAQKGLRGIFHCFGDGEEAALQITDMGFLLGIGGVLTYKNAGVPAMLANIDLGSIVLETDAPYLSPVPYRGKRNESSYLKNIAEKLAEVKNVSMDELARITTANAEKLFGL